jgi:hypothetical protein
MPAQLSPALMPGCGHVKGECPCFDRLIAVLRSIEAETLAAKP